MRRYPVRGQSVSLRLLTQTDDLVDAASLLGAAGRFVAVENQAIARLDGRGHA